VAAGKLRAVSWVLPPLGLGEHPPESVCQGENWTTQVINAIMQSPYWSSTAVFLMWDDYGGYYDHVPPPQVDRFGPGPRVPLLIISPYAKRGYVSHTVYEQSSMLKFVERRYQLGSLTARDAAASDMLDGFDFSQSPQDPMILSPRVCPEAPAGQAHPATYSAFDND
jgi:phospholipase C